MSNTLVIEQTVNELTFDNNTTILSMPVENTHTITFDNSTTVLSMVVEQVNTNLVLNSTAASLSMPVAEFNIISRDIQGPRGPRGLAGHSAYQIAVDNGFVGTEEQWLDSLEGPQGIPGTAILSGDGPPSDSMGIAGDFYFDKINKAIYGPKTTVWGDGVYLVSPLVDSEFNYDTNGNLIQIDFSDLTSKVFTYVNGVLTTIAYDSKTWSYNYNIDGQLESITIV